MKTLYIIRHAKAEHHSLTMTDFQRNLTPLGVEKATHIAKELAHTLHPNQNTLIISSSANRAKQTAEIFASALGYPIGNILEDERIYEGHHLDILQVINSVEDQYDKLLIFGHNPGLSNLTKYISDSYIDLSTSNVVEFELDDQFTFSMVSSGNSKAVKLLK